MALTSSVLMFAGSPQALLGVGSAQESLFLLMDILPAYVRQLRGEQEQTLIELSSSWRGLLQNLEFAFQEPKDGKSSAFSIHIGSSGFCRWLGADSEGHLSGLAGLGAALVATQRTPSRCRWSDSPHCAPPRRWRRRTKGSSQFRAAGHQASACRQSAIHPPIPDRRPPSRSRPIRCSTRALISKSRKRYSAMPPSRCAAAGRRYRPTPSLRRERAGPR